MKVCLISKYPPIEGGVSERTYWLAKELGERGNEVHIVTNAQEVEEEYRVQIDDGREEYEQLNVHIHSTTGNTNPWHIPFSKAYAERIASLAIEVIEEHNIQLIDSTYILPYGIAGYIAKNITGRPQILRHAGSDIGKLYASPGYKTLFEEVFRRVDKIVTIPPMKEMFLSLGILESRIAFEDQVSVDTTAFHPGVSPYHLAEYVGREIPECPIITFIGKINYYWQTKGIGELVEAASEIKEDFLLLFVANGKGLEEFKDLIKKKGLEKRSLFIGFVPPWEIPSIIKLSTCVVAVERDFPIKYHAPMIPREVMAVGKCLILSEELAGKGCYGNLVDGENVLLVDPKNIKQFRTIIEDVVRYPDKAERIGQNAYEHSRKIEHFDEYINYTINLYSSLLENP